MKTDNKIYSISEAFSMQPKHISVMDEEHYKSYYDKPNACKEIKLEPVQIGEVVMAYVGYNFEDKKIFQYLANTVNVHYF